MEGKSQYFTSLLASAKERYERKVMALYYIEHWHKIEVLHNHLLLDLSASGFYNHWLQNFSQSALHLKCMLDYTIDIRNCVYYDYTSQSSTVEVIKSKRLTKFIKCLKYNVFVPFVCHFRLP